MNQLNQAFLVDLLPNQVFELTVSLNPTSEIVPHLEINSVQLFSFTTIYRQSLLKDVQRGPQIFLLHLKNDYPALVEFEKKFCSVKYLYKTQSSQLLGQIHNIYTTYIHLSIHQSIYLSIYLSITIIYLSLLSIYLSIYLPTNVSI